MLIVFGVSCAAVAVSTAGAVLTIGGLSEFLEMIRTMSKSFVQGGLDWGDLISMALLMFLVWTLVIMTGFLAVILARTVLISRDLRDCWQCSCFLSSISRLRECTI